MKATISTLSLTRSEGLPVNLPKGATAETQIKAQINVSITSEGKLALNRQLIDLNNLEGAVRNLMQPNSDTKVDHGQVVEVMARLRRIKGTKLAIAAQR